MRQKQGKKRSFFISRLYCALHEDLLKQTEVEWKIDGDVLHYYCTSEPWVVSFYSEMARKLKMVSCVIQNMPNGSSPAVRKDTRNKVVFEFGKTSSKMLLLKLTNGYISTLTRSAIQQSLMVT